MKTLQKIFAIWIFVLCISIDVHGINYISAGVGPAPWHVNTSWLPAGIPTQNDNVTIADGHTITVGVTGIRCNNLTVEGSLTWNSNIAITVFGDYLISATGRELNTGTIQFNPPGALVTVNGLTSGKVLYSFYSSRTIAAGSIISKANTTIRIMNNYTITNLGSFTTGIVDARAGSAWINDAGATLTITRTSFMLNRTFTANALGNNVILSYIDGDVPLTTAGYYNLTIGYSGTKILPANTIIAGNLTINSANTLNSNNFDLTVGGNWSNSGIFTSGTTTVTFNGTSTISGAATTSFNNVAISGALTGHATTMNVGGNWANGGTYTHNSGTVVFNGTTTVSGASTTGFNNVTINATRTLTGDLNDMNVAGNWVNNGTYTHNSGRVTFDGTSTVSGSSNTSFNNVAISAAGTLTGHATTMSVAGNFASNGTYTHNNGTVVFNGTTIVGGASTTTFNNITITGTLHGHVTNMNVFGNFTNNGTFDYNNGTVTFNGSAVAAQSVSTVGTTAFYRLTINNTGGGVILSSGIFVVNDVLTLSNGTLNINGLVFVMEASAAKYARIAPVTGSGAVSNANNFIVQRHISVRDTTWCDMASPNGGTMANWNNDLYFSYPHTPPGVISNVLEYNEALADYAGVSDATALSPGKGFEIFLSDNTYTATSPVTVTTVGVPNIAQAAIPLGYTTTLYGGAYAGQNLVGNPYASAVTIGSMTFTNASNTVDVYDHTTESYQPVTGAGIIGPGQGFWAYATGAGASVLVPETAKSVNQTQILRGEVADEPYMKLKLSILDNNHQTGYTLRIASNSIAIDGFDMKEDHPFRKSPSKAAASITSVLDDGKKLAINTFNSTNENYSMPLATKVGVSGLYKIETSGLELMNEYRYIFLEDKLLGKMINLKAQQEYSFKFNSTDKQDRFILHFSKNDQPVISVIANDLESQIEILPSPGGNIINFNFQETTNTTVTVSNLIGQTIVEPVNIEANNQSVNISLPEEYNGMYILRVESTKGSINKKFVKK